MSDDTIQQDFMKRVQGALSLNVAFIGVVNGLFEKLSLLGQAAPEDIARESKKDVEYVKRWFDTAYAFEFVDEVGRGVFKLTDLGEAFCANTPGTLIPFAVQAVLSSHLAERTAGLMETGECPGEMVLAERETILPWFGPMLEYMFGPFLEKEILPNVPEYKYVAEKGGLALDLGCGNGWYIRRLIKRFPGLHGMGLDGFEENIKLAAKAAKMEGIENRVTFQTGNIVDFKMDSGADLIAMNRSLHHVWDQKENVFRKLKDHLKSEGCAIIWEPNWPVDRKSLRKPANRGMSFQNLAEHVQGNHFLRAEEIAEQFQKVGMTSKIYMFGGHREAVIVGQNNTIY